MKKEQLAFLIGGFAFGILFGVGVANAWLNRPDLDARAEMAALDSPAGPMAPTQVGAAAGDAGAPMMAEIRALKQRVNDDPQDADAFVRLANLYHDGGMWDQAIGYYERALELRPGTPDLLTDMGVCFRGRKDFARALELFQRANELEPAHWQSLFNVVVVAAFDLGRFDQARATLEKLEAMEPTPPNLAELRRAVDQAEAPERGGGSS